MYSIKRTGDKFSILELSSNKIISVFDTKKEASSHKEKLMAISGLENELRSICNDIVNKIQKEIREEVKNERS